MDPHELDLSKAPWTDPSEADTIKVDELILRIGFAHWETTEYPPEALSDHPDQWVVRPLRSVPEIDADYLGKGMDRDASWRDLYRQLATDGKLDPEWRPPPRVLNRETGEYERRWP